MKILVSAIFYSSLVILVSLISVFKSQQPYALLPLPFGIAILSFASMGLKMNNETSAIRTVLTLTVFLLLGTGTSVIQLAHSILKFENQFSPTHLSYALTFVFSLCYLLVSFILIRRRKLS